MKVSTIFAYVIPELRGLSAAQLLKIWGACAPFSRNALYVHLVLLGVCCSLVFNFFLRATDSAIFLPLVGLALGLTVPSNLYFFLVFKDRREQLRQFLEENWAEFHPQ
jgi:hypothetical protein